MPKDDDDNKTVDPPADPPADPPVDPPKDAVQELRELYDSLTERVESIAARLEDATAGNDVPPDATPISRPWTARGRR